MSRNQNRTTSKFMSFLGDTLSISNLFTGRKDEKQNAAEKPEKDTRDMSTSEYFDFLANTLSISTVYA